MRRFAICDNAWKDSDGGPRPGASVSAGEGPEGRLERGRRLLRLRPRSVRLGGERLERVEEGGRLTLEEADGSQEFGRAHGYALSVSRTHDRAPGQPPPEEDRGLGHDQVSLEFFAGERRFVQVREAEVESSRVGDRLDVLFGRQVAGSAPWPSAFRSRCCEVD